MESAVASQAQPVVAQPETLFISRAGADAEIAAEIGRVLEAAGYAVILQQWDFANRHFIERMHEALASGARVVALLSPDYLRSDHCQAEWMNAIADDPLNRKGGLVLLRVAECEPRGLLAGLAYWDLVPALTIPAGLADIVRRAVRRSDHRERASAGAEPRSEVFGGSARSRAPSGTVTFLFARLDGAAPASQREAAAREAARTRCDDIVRAAVDAHAGYVFKTVDDLWCIAFPVAAAAIEAALAIQLVLRDAAAAAGGDGPRLRMALHSGTSHERDADYFGPTVDWVAQLVTIGHGAQILLSQATVELARSQRDSGGLRDLGQHRLKGANDAVRVFQLDVPGAPADFPPLASARVGQTNFPPETKLIGRDGDVAEIVELFARFRLVTLVGVGGVGKTSCALKAGAALDGFTDGTWFVGFAALTDPRLVAAEVAALFSVVESNRPVVENLVAHLRGKNLLIVLDNCEHVIEACSQLASSLLLACPGVSLLATSREPLRISGEHVYYLPMLSAPERGAGLTVDDALQYGSIALFVTRAKAADSRFTLTDQNVASVAEICRRLDGIPLALELAAARVRVLAPRQIEQKLDARFRILTGGARNALPRQQTMRALIDWSYDLLDARERTLFDALSVFSGSFLFESAVAVCARDEIEDFEVLDGLTSLVEKSLVIAEASERETRYRLLESMRQYGRERLDDCGTFNTIARRHAAAYTELAERLEDDYATTRYREWVTGAAHEIENIRTALTWTFSEPGDLELGLRLAATLRRIFNTSHPAEARRWVGTALERVTAATSPRVVARLELADAHLATRLNKFSVALGAARRALENFEAAGDRHGIANAKRLAGRSLIFLGQAAEGEQLVRSALETYSALGLKKVGGLLLDLGSARSACGDLAGAREFFARALDEFRLDQDEGQVAITAGTLAEAEYHGGDTEAAVRHAQDALAAAHALNSGITVWILSNLSAFLIALDRFAEATACAHEALRAALARQSQFWVTVLLQHCSAVLALAPDPDHEREIAAREASARLAGYVDRTLSAIEVTRELTERREYDRTIAALSGSLGSERLALLVQDGERLDDAQAVELALAASRAARDAARAPAVAGTIFR